MVSLLGKAICPGGHGRASTFIVEKRRHPLITETCNRWIWVVSIGGLSLFLIFNLVKLFFVGMVGDR